MQRSCLQKFHADTKSDYLTFGRLCLNTHLTKDCLKCFKILFHRILFWGLISMMDDLVAGGINRQGVSFFGGGRGARVKSQVRNSKTRKDPDAPRMNQNFSGITQRDPELFGMIHSKLLHFQIFHYRYYIISRA